MGTLTKGVKFRIFAGESFDIIKKAKTGVLKLKLQSLKLKQISEKAKTGKKPGFSFFGKEGFVWCAQLQR